MYVHAVHPAVPAAWEGTCPYVPKGPGSGWRREDAVGTWEVGGSEATSVGGDACGTSRSKRSVEPGMERGSSWLGQITGKSRLRYKGVCSVPGEQDHLFVGTLKKTTIQEQSRKPRAAAGVVGNHHY